MRLCQTSSLPYRCQPLDNLILYPPPSSICSTMPRNKSRFFRWRPIFSFARQLHFPPIVHIAGFVGRRGEKGEVTRLSLGHHQRSGKKWIIPALLIPENSFIISHKNHCQCYYPRYSSGKMKIVAHLVKGEMKTIEKGTSCLSRVVRLLSGHINQGSSTSPPENRPSWLSRPIPLINRRNQSNLAAREVLKTDIKTRLLCLSLRENDGVPSLT